MTSLYNHNTLGTKEKPLIPNAEFKALIEHLNSGDADISKWMDQYSLEPFQKQMVQSKLRILTN